MSNSIPAQTLSEPKFPVLDDDPPFSKAIRAFRADDWRNLFLATAVSAPYGYAIGRPILMRPMMYTSMTLGFVFGVLHGWQNSYARLSGYAENSLEQSKFGTADSQLSATSSDAAITNTSS